MRTTPFNEPDDSAVGLLPLREAVVDCLEELCAEDQFMLDATFVERVTIRALAERMGLHKSYTHRLVQRAQVRLRDVCIQHATIQAYLGVAGATPPQSPAVPPTAGALLEIEVVVVHVGAA